MIPANGCTVHVVDVTDTIDDGVPTRIPDFAPNGRADEPIAVNGATVVCRSILPEY
jgi:hypothetical protein